MAFDPITLALAKKYTQETAEGMGAVQGKPGPAGKDGVSPTVTVKPNAAGDGTVVTITDANGTKTFEVLNGENGEPGAAGPMGPAGEDGFSPQISVENISGGHKVTITDASGTQSFNVMDGVSGGGGTGESSDVSDATLGISIIDLIGTSAAEPPPVNIPKQMVFGKNPSVGGEMVCLLGISQEIYDLIFSGWYLSIVVVESDDGDSYTTKLLADGAYLIPLTNPYLGNITDFKGLTLSNGGSRLDVVNPVQGIYTDEEYNNLTDTAKANGTYFVNGSDNKVKIVSDGKELIVSGEKETQVVEVAPYLVKAPVGTIVYWSGSVDNIPAGWHICDGTDGTPDLRNRFIMGAGPDYFGLVFTSTNQGQPSTTSSIALTTKKDISSVKISYEVSCESYGDYFYIYKGSNQEKGVTGVVSDYYDISNLLIGEEIRFNYSKNSINDTNKDEASFFLVVNGKTITSEAELSEFFDITQGESYGFSSSVASIGRVPSPFEMAGNKEIDVPLKKHTHMIDVTTTIDGTKKTKTLTAVDADNGIAFKSDMYTVSGGFELVPVGTKSNYLEADYISGAVDNPKIEIIPPYYALCAIMKITADETDGYVPMDGDIPVIAKTSAEYEALTDEEKQADVAYVITDDNEGASSGGSGTASSAGEVYSTEETRVGTWIDGKPLYRKVFTLVVTSTNNCKIYTGLNGPDIEIIKIEGLKKHHSDTDKLTHYVPIPSWNNSADTLRVNSSIFHTTIDSASPEIQIKTHLAAEGDVLIYILEYTKNTD